MSQRKTYATFPTALLTAFIAMVVFSAWSSAALGQVENKLRIWGSVKDDKLKLENVFIEVYSGSDMVSRSTTEANGKFEAIMEFGDEYTVVIGKNGYASKKINFDTRKVPESQAGFGFEFHFNVDLFRPPPGFDMNVLNDPIGYVKYSEDAEKFVHDVEHTALVQERLGDMMRELEYARQEAQENYITAIEDGDRFLKEGDFYNARIQYESAQLLKPEERYPTQQIEKIAEMEFGEEERQKQYDEWVAKADADFDAQKFETAKTNYQEALKVKPKEKYPKQRLGEIDDKIAALAKEEAEKARLEAEKKAKEKQFLDLVASADDAYMAKSYDRAKEQYIKAQELRPEDPHIMDRLDAIKKIQAEAAAQATLDQDYRTAVDEADKAFRSKDWANARDQYKAAQDLKPTESYPANQLKEIDRLEEEERKRRADEEYSDVIAAADKAFNSKDWDNARSGYNDAIALRPSDPYPKGQLDAIDKEVEAQAQKDRDDQYNELINQADIALKGEKYQDAKKLYGDAADLKPGEAYPRNKIVDIDNLLAASEAAEKLEQQYNDLITQADRDFDGKNYDAAKNSYTQAAAVKPDEKYPKERLEEIDRLVAELADAEAAAKVDKEYNDLISQADDNFNNENYEDARQLYTQASGVKPSEKYPKNRIEEIERLVGELADAAAAAKVDKEYNDLIAQADDNFNNENYEDAKQLYTQASGVKPSEKYPKNRIEEIERLVVELADAAAAAKIDKEYNDLIAQADDNFNNENYQAAKDLYNQALGVKSSEKYPKDRIDEIDRLVVELADAAELAKIDKQYNDLIAQADDKFNNEQYEEAKGLYKQASGVKSSEKYPKDRMDEIDRLVQEMADAALAEEERKAKQAEFDGLVAKADAAFDKEEYAAARSNYEAALKVQAGAPHPSQRLTRIEEILNDKEEQARQAELAAKLEKDYDKAIAEADAAFDKEDYEKARQGYNAALEILPERSEYPTGRLDEITRILSERSAVAAEQAEQERIDREYNEAIATGDKAFGKGDYDEAKTAFLSAKDLKPAETYPQSQLDKIDQVLADEAAKLAAEEEARKKDADFRSAISRADDQYDAENYEGALASYKEALDIKPGEVHPTRRVEEIEGLLKELAEQSERERAEAEAKRAREARYNELIAQADNQFANEQWEEARESYRESLDEKPGSSYPQQKIKEIGEKIAEAERIALAKQREAERQKALDEKYEGLVSTADAAFDKKDYGTAKRNYLAARDVKPDEDHPKTRLSEIDDLIAAMSAPKGEGTGEGSSKEDEFVHELAKNYPQGVTEEVTTETTKTITRRIVVNGNEGHEYRRVVHNWGGKFFFKDGKPISEFIFNTETAK